MPPLNEAQRKWLDDLLVMTGGTKVGPPAGGLAAPLASMALPNGGDERDGTPKGADPDGVARMSGQVSADSAAPHKGGFKVKVGRIAPIHPEGGTDSESEDIWVDFEIGKGAMEKVSFYQMVNSPDFVENEIANATGKMDPNIPFTERPQIKEMTVTYKRGGYVVVPMNLIRRSPNAQAKRYWQREKGKNIFPVDKSRNVLFDTINTPNIILCVEYLEQALADRLAQNLKVIEVGAAFGKILQGYSAVSGGAPKGHPPVGNRTAYRPNSRGPQRGAPEAAEAARFGRPAARSETQVLEAAERAVVESQANRPTAIATQCLPRP